MTTLNITTEAETKMVEIPVIQRPIPPRKLVASEYLRLLKAQEESLETKLVDIKSQISQLEAEGIKVADEEIIGEVVK